MGIDLIIFCLAGAVLVYTILTRYAVQRAEMKTKIALDALATMSTALDETIDRAYRLGYEAGVELVKEADHGALD